MENGSPRRQLEKESETSEPVQHARLPIYLQEDLLTSVSSLDWPHEDPNVLLLFTAVFPAAKAYPAWSRGPVHSNDGACCFCQQGLGSQHNGPSQEKSFPSPAFRMSCLGVWGLIKIGGNLS